MMVSANAKARAKAKKRAEQINKDAGITGKPKAKKKKKATA